MDLRQLGRAQRAGSSIFWDGEEAFELGFLSFEAFEALAAGICSPLLSRSPRYS